MRRKVSQPQPAKAMGPSPQALHQLLNEIRRLEVTSLNDESNTGEQENDLEQNVAGPPHQDRLPFAGRVKAERLTQAIAKLPERKQQFFCTTVLRAGAHHA